MPRPYSFDHFQAKKPMQAAVGTPGRLGNDEDKQKPLKSELPHTQTEELPGANGGIHYGMKNAETVKRLQARRAKRTQEAGGRGKAATKRPTGKRATGTATPAKKAATTRATGTAVKTAAKKATTGTAAAKKTTGTATRSTGMEARGGTTATTTAKRGGTLSRLVGAVVKGTKGVARQAAAAKQARSAKKSTRK